MALNGSVMMAPARAPAWGLPSPPFLGLTQLSHSHGPPLLTHPAPALRCAAPHRWPQAQGIPWYPSALSLSRPALAHIPCSSTALRRAPSLAAGTGPVWSGGPKHDGQLRARQLGGGGANGGRRRVGRH